MFEGVMPTWTEELQEEKKPEGPWGQSLVGPVGLGCPCSQPDHRPRASRALVQQTQGSCLQEK